MGLACHAIGDRQFGGDVAIVLLEEALQKTQPLESLTVRFAPLNQAIADIAVPENEKKGFYELVARAKESLAD